MSDRNTENSKIRRTYEQSHLQPTSEKDDDYIKSTCDYYIRHNNMVSVQRSELQVLYDAAQGSIDDDDYKYVTNPMNSDNQKFQKFPAKLRNYDIIKPIINAFLGENSRRRHGATVIVGNTDAQDKRKDGLSEKLASLMAQDLVNNLNNMGVDTGMPSTEPPNYAEAKMEFEENYDDARARFGQQALDYIWHNQNLDEIIQRLKYDWLVAGRCATYKDLRYEDVVFTRVDPRDLSIIGWGESLYGEDAEAAVYAKEVTATEVLTKFYEEISEREDKDDVLEYLNEAMFKDSAFTEYTNITTRNMDESPNDRGDYSVSDSKNLTLYHTVWNTFTPIKILYYYDEFGKEVDMYVDDTYVLDKEAGDVRIETLTIREWYECYRLDDLFYFDGGRGRVQRHMINNISSCKLPYNMATFGYCQDSPDSIVKQMLQYQMLYNIFHYRWELLLAQNKGKIMMLPLGLIPDGGGRGWDEEKFFYFMESMKIAMYDETAPNAAAMLQGIKSIDLELGNSVDRMWSNMTAIKQEAWDLVGMNRQRYGQTFASDGKGTTEQAIVQSTTITASWQFQFDKYMEREYRGILDYSKVAYLDGKKGMYINSEAKKAWFELSKDEALEYMESDFNVFAKNSVFENEKHNKAEQLILTMGQNGLKPDVMLEVLDTNNISKLKQLVKEGLAAEKAFEQQMGQQAQQTAQMQAEAAKALQDSKNATDIRVAEIQANAKITVAQQTDEEMMGELVDDTNQMAKDVDVAKVQSNMAAKEKYQSDNNMKRESHQMKRETNQTAMNIAKENKNRYDK